MPSEDDQTLYWVAWVSRSRKTKIGNTYLTGWQIRKAKGYWGWEIYAYSPFEPITAPPLPRNEPAKMAASLEILKKADNFLNYKTMEVLDLIEYRQEAEAQINEILNKLDEKIGFVSPSVYVKSVIVEPAQFQQFAGGLLRITHGIKVRIEIAV